MKIKGSITIYLSIIIVSVMLIINIISESARIKAIQAKSQGFTDLAVESIIAGYAKQVYKEYGVLLVWENQPFAEQLKKYIQANINMADLKIQGTNFMNTHLVDIEITKKEYVTDKGDEKFVEQILTYMKYFGAIKAADKLIQKYNIFKNENQSQKPINKDVTDIVDFVGDELKKIVKNINKRITDLKDTNNLEKKLFEASQSLKKLKSIDFTESKTEKNTRKFLQKYRKLMAAFDKKADDVNSIIILIEKYEAKKEQLLKKNSYISGDRDYIDENLKTLENVKNRIKEIKELTVSDFSKINSESIGVIKKSIKVMKNIIDDLKSLKISKVSKEDEKSLSIIENANNFLKSGVLSLVIEDVTDISNVSIPDSNLPSKLEKENKQGSLLKNIKNKAILSIYTNNKFGNYLNSKKDSYLEYEMEYIINGKSSDRDNLKATVEKIVAIRNALNFLYLVSDNKKLNEISIIASSSASAIGIPFLEPVFKVFLTEVWAFAESINDTKSLLKGEYIPLTKNASNWKTELTNLFQKNTGKLNDNKGLNYIEYLQMLLMTPKSQSFVDRILDLMQLNIQKKYNANFLIGECIQSLEVKAEFQTDPLFTAIPLVINGLNRKAESYRYHIICEKGY